MTRSPAAGCIGDGAREGNGGGAGRNPHRGALLQLAAHAGQRGNPGATDPEPETINLETLNLETLDLETFNLETLNLETLNLESLNLETLNLETLDLETLDLNPDPQTKVPVAGNTIFELDADSGLVNVGLVVNPRR